MLSSKYHQDPFSSHMDDTVPTEGVMNKMILSYFRA